MVLSGVLAFKVGSLRDRNAGVRYAGSMDRAPRQRVTVFIGDVTGSDEWRVPTSEALPLGATRDVSISGMFLTTRKRPAIGSILEITIVWGDDSGRTKAEVIRHEEDGIALRFVDPGDGFEYIIAQVASG